MAQAGVQSSSLAGLADAIGVTAGEGGSVTGVASPDCYYEDKSKPNKGCYITPKAGYQQLTAAELENKGYKNVSMSWMVITAYGLLTYVLQLVFGIFGVIAGRGGKRNCLMAANILNAFVTLMWIGLVIGLSATMFSTSSLYCSGGGSIRPPYQAKVGAFLYTITIIYLCLLPYVICAVICCICVLMAVMAMPKD